MAPQPKRQSTIGAWLGLKPPEAVPVPEEGYLVVDLFCSIGGVSATVRRVGVLHTAPTYKHPVVLFALHAPTAESVADALRGVDGCAVGDAAWKRT